MNTKEYANPLIERYASKDMSFIFSHDNKFGTWRRLWIALAKAEKQLGLPITDEQIRELEEHALTIDYEKANEYEKKLRHDVMAHVHAYGDQCPSARGIIHLGATSAFVGDNTDVIVYSQGLNLVRKKLINCIDQMTTFALEHKDLPTLGFTHFQPAQLTTVGKRACLWIQDMLMDLDELDFVLNHTKLRGVKGTTGTQASFLELFEGDHEKVLELDRLVARTLGFTDSYAVTGQTYPRKYDARVANVLSSIAQTMYKFSNDMRLLQHLKEMEEPFEKHQIGSSAMAYKRNPMRSERMGALARYVIVTALNPAITASTQWFERTLDDSANKRISMPESFLAVDAILNLCLNVTGGMVVYDKVIAQHIEKELPFMATENIIMHGVKKGGDRQELHERIRIHSMEAGRQVKEEGNDNDLIERIKNDPTFALTEEEFEILLNPKSFVGRAPEQVMEFYEDQIRPVLDANADLLGERGEVNL
jgi:adenylosuccinate lyase